MTFVRTGGFYIPGMRANQSADANIVTSSDVALLDADEEEYQAFGYVRLAAGSGSKTFGTSGSKIGWLPGASITFQSAATLRVGVKQSSTIDFTSGPPARATIGAAAFDVYKGLVGGTDTITSTTWREDAMASGTPFTVTHGDLIAVCFHLDIVSAAQSIKIRTAGSEAALGFPSAVLVTSGPTYTFQSLRPNFILIFDDGTIGWLHGTWLSSTFAGFETIGNGNYFGNIIRPPFNCKVDAVQTLLLTAGTTNTTVGLWALDGSSQPTTLTNGTVAVDYNILNTNLRFQELLLPAEVSLTKGVDYFVGAKQNSATGITVFHYDVSDTSYHQVNGLDSTCYAVKSTSGGAFAAQNSSKRRSANWVRVSQIDDGMGTPPPNYVLGI